MSLKNIHFILIRPQIGENIGLVARAIKNFKITKLRIINPRCEWPNQKAIATSVGAKDILKSTKIYNSLENANNIPISISKQIQKGIYFLDDAIHDNYFFEDKIISLNNISQSLHGDLNKQNILAAYVVSLILQMKIKNFLKVVGNFEGLPHRLEKIIGNNELEIINNSKATNLDSTLKSISNYNNIYLIIGGRMKEENFSSIANYKKHILRCYIIGESSDFIYKQLNNLIDSKISHNLENAVKEIFLDLHSSKIKSTILFSPGCSSFDQFNNFEDRGNKFKKFIKKEITQ